MGLNDLKAALVACSTSTYHYTAPDNAGYPRIVWAEESRDDLTVDNVHGEKGITGTIGLFSKTENDQLIESIENALNGLRIWWRLNNVLYEQDTRVIHHEWLFYIYG